MNFKTKQQLGSLEVLLSSNLIVHLPYHENGGSWQPFHWDRTTSPAFTPLNLAEAEGWMKETDPEYALLDWLAVEESGFASPNVSQYWRGHNDAKILLTDRQRQQRQNTYSELISYFQKAFCKVEAFTLSVKPDYGKRGHTDYTWSFIIGQQQSGAWIGLAPNVPSETGRYVLEAFHSSVHPPEIQTRTSQDDSSALPNELQAFLTAIPPIKIYGWYDGGYNHIHSYSLQSACADSKEAVIETLWRNAQFLEVVPFDCFNLKSRYYSPHEKDESDRYSRISRFLAESVSALTVYRFCFWDIEMLYLLGEVEKGDHIGMFTKSQFTYNP
ncbi:MAG: nuclease A inhibitor family protein [Phormidesmis sp.]